VLDAGEAVAAGVGHLDAEGVADGVEEQAEVAARDAGVPDRVRRQLGHDQRRRDQRHAP
jgi:hypothetical protein